MRSRHTRDLHIDGFIAPGFEAVRAEFARNFARRGEIGAAVAAYWRGDKVVDLWGGRRTPDGGDPWNEDTMVVVMSTTKGLSAMTLAIANARGWLDYDAPVARYWPEFAANGKAAVTVRQLLGHEAGLVLLDEPLTVEKLRDLDHVARLLARQTPAWPPGTRHGYHTMTLGLYMQELMRRVDPAHRTLGRFFSDEIAAPLGLDFHIGLPRDIPAERLARVKTLSPWRGLLALRYTPPAVTLKMIAPGSLLRRSFAGLSADPNDRAYLEVEVPAGNGVGTARAIARAYSACAEGGAELGLTPETFARITAPPVVAGPGRGARGAVLLLARLPAARTDRLLRLEPARLRLARGRWLVRVRRPRRASGLRLRDEPAGLLPGERSAREGAARRGVPRDRATRRPTSGRGAGGRGLGQRTATSSHQSSCAPVVRASMNGSSSRTMRKPATRRSRTACHDPSSCARCCALRCSSRRPRGA